MIIRNERPERMPLKEILEMFARMNKFIKKPPDMESAGQCRNRS